MSAAASRRVVYYDPHAADGEVAPPFASGEAGCVWVGADGVVQTDVRVLISPNSLHALHGHGVVARLAELGPELGPIGGGRDALLGPVRVERALAIFYDADRKTYGARHDLLVRAASGPDDVEYRIVVDNREYQRTLSQLQFMTSTAARMGQGIRLRV